MSKKQNPTTESSEPTAFSELATRASLTKAMTQIASENDSENLNPRQEEDDQADDDAPGTSDGETDQDDDGEDGAESDDDEDSQDDPGDDQEEDGEDAEDDYRNLTRDEAIAIATRQRKGVDKLRKRSDVLATSLAEAEAKAQQHETAARQIEQWNTILSDPATAPNGVAQMIAYVADTHGLPVDEIIQKATASVGSTGLPDFEADARESADEIEWEYEDEKERWVKATAAHERKRYLREQSNRSPSQNVKPQHDDVSARFEKEFKQTVADLKDDYPSFTLTKEMALGAVTEFPKLSVEDAVFKKFHKQITAKAVDRARKESAQTKPLRMVDGSGKSGRSVQVPKNQGQWSRSDMERAMRMGIGSRKS